MDNSKPSPVKPRRRRRWFSYSLRTLLLLTMLAAAVLGVWVNRAERQRRAVAVVTRLGGSWEFPRDRKRRGPPPKHSWMRKLLGEHYYSNIVYVNLRETGVRDHDLKDIGALVGLEQLFLANTGVGDAGIEHISALKKLTWLNLDRTAVGDTGLSYLKGTTGPTRLDICFTPVTDEGLEHLRTMTGLRELWLFGTPVTDAGVDRLKKSLPDLIVVR